MLYEELRKAKMFLGLEGRILVFDAEPLPRVYYYSNEDSGYDTLCDYLFEKDFFFKKGTIGYIRHLEDWIALIEYLKGEKGMVQGNVGV